MAFKESALSIKKRVACLHDSGSMTVVAPQQLVMSGRRYFIIANLVRYDLDDPWGRVLARRERIEVCAGDGDDLEDAIRYSLHEYLIDLMLAVE